MILSFDIKINALHLHSSIEYHSTIKYSDLTFNSEKNY